MEKKFFGVHCEKELPKTNQSLEFRVEKVIKTKIDKLHVEWRDYDNSFKVGLIKRISLHKTS